MPFQGNAKEDAWGWHRRSGEGQGGKFRGASCNPPKNSFIWGPPGALRQGFREKSWTFLLRLGFRFPHLQMGNCGESRWPWSLVQILKIPTSLLPCKIPSRTNELERRLLPNQRRRHSLHISRHTLARLKTSAQQRNRGISLFPLGFSIGLGFSSSTGRGFANQVNNRISGVVNFLVSLAMLLKIWSLNPGFMDVFQKIFQSHSLPLLPVYFQRCFPQDGPDFFWLQPRIQRRIREKNLWKTNSNRASKFCSEETN